MTSGLFTPTKVQHEVCDVGKKNVCIDCIYSHSFKWKCLSQLNIHPGESSPVQLQYGCFFGVFFFFSCKHIKKQAFSHMVSNLTTQLYKLIAFSYNIDQI